MIVFCVLLKVATSTRPNAATQLAHSLMSTLTPQQVHQARPAVVVEELKVDAPVVVPKTQEERIAELTKSVEEMCRQQARLTSLMQRQVDDLSTRNASSVKEMQDMCDVVDGLITVVNNKASALAGHS